MDEQSQKIALVTGANRGIGYAVAEELLRRGFIVLVGARDETRGRAAVARLSALGPALWQPLDVVDDASVNAAARALDERFGRLDVLINNAGIAAARLPPSEVRAESLRPVLETNVIGVVRVLHAFLPLLRRSPAARIVNVSSLRGSLGSPGAFAGQPSLPYSLSKTALNALTVHYARELAGAGILVNAASPGHVATDFNGHTGTRTPAEGAAVIVRLACLQNETLTGGFFDENGLLPW